MSSMIIQSLSLVIPCFNEEEGLPTLFLRLSELRASLFEYGIKPEFVIVDDGSSDTSWSMLQEEYAMTEDVVLLQHNRNIGFGRALKTGIKAATGDIVATVDADTNYDLRQTPDMLSYFAEGYDIVTASPFIKGGGWDYPFYRYLLSNAVTILYRLALGKNAKPLGVYTCGFRAYRREVLEHILPQADDFLATAEILVWALLMEYKVAEMPVTVHDRMHGCSKMNMVKMTFRHLGFLLSLWRRS